MHGRLNSFQKTMLQWNDMHPYNAVHVVRIPVVLNIEQLSLNARATLEQRSLTHLVLNRRRNTFTYQGGSADCPVKIINCGDDPNAALQTEVERQLNTPFVPTPGFSPFRFFAVPTKSSFFLGLVYFHPIADAEAIVFLLRDLVRTCRQSAPPSPPPAVQLYPDHRVHLLCRHPGVIVRRLLALPGQACNLRQSHRPRYRDALDMSNGFNLFSLSSEQLRALIAAGKSWGVTVNDLLLALLMKSLSPLAGGRAQAARRRNLTAGCIVNLRRDLGMDSTRTFGLFLGSFTVTHVVPEGIGLRQLAGDIRQQTVGIKQHRLYLGTPMELALGRFVLQFFSPERRKKFYQKNYPLWGGITNMNLNSLWGTPDDDGPMDYFRGVSTGPVTPLVFSVTTLGDRANVGLSFRATVFEPEDIEKVKRNFMQNLELLQEAE